MVHLDDEEGGIVDTVPIPAYCYVHVVDGSHKVQVTRGSALTLLQSGCRIRIGAPYSSVEYIVASEDFQQSSFFLTTPYDFSASGHFAISRCDQDHPNHMNSVNKVAIHLGHEEIQPDDSFREREKSPLNPLLPATTTCTHLRVWKLIPKPEDKRLLWRIHYDEGKVPWFPIYDKNHDLDHTQSHSKFSIYFNVKKYWTDVESACQDDFCNSDGCIHQQRLHYFETIQLADIVKETYRTACSWYPISSSIDSVKWSKLAKKMNFFSAMKNVAHEVDMAFHRHCKERKMDIGGFERVLRELAYMRYPPPLYEHDEALLLFLWSTVVNLPHVNEAIWRQAEIAAMHVEMIRTCAQIRISTFWRKIFHSTKYQRLRVAQLCISKYSRMILARKKAYTILQSIKEEKMNRLRRKSAVLIQKVWRRYHWRSWYRNMLVEQRHQEKVDLAKRQKLLWEERRILAAWSNLFKALIRTQAMMTVKKLLAYDRALLVKVPIESSDKLFSTCIYQTMSGFTVTCHETKSQMVSRLDLSNDRVCDGLSDESSTFYGYQESAGISKSDNETKITSLLRRPVELAWWLLSQIIIKVDDSSSPCTILLKFEVHREKKWVQVRRVQSRWRARVALKRARCEVVNQYEKSFDRMTQLFYYVHIRTGSTQWTKPQVLGNEDIPDPLDVWRPVTYEDPKTGATCTYYENLKTGQKSWLSEEAAARMVQRQFRKMQAQALTGKVDMRKIAGALQLVHHTESNFAKSPEKLYNKVNYALLCHCIIFDHDTALRLYQEAIETSPYHPVICRAYGLFMMSRCDQPIPKVVKVSTKLFQDAESADPGHSMFQSAIDNFFYWAVVLHPKKPDAILNWALTNQIILGNYKYADKLYRLALSITPAHEALRLNYDFFESQRYPGGLYASGGPPSSAVIRSRTIEEREEWGEWKKRKDPLSPKAGFDTIWFNSLSKHVQFEEPRWKEVWTERVKRSRRTSESEKGLWIEFWDPLLRKTFYYSRLTDDYVCQQPQHVSFVK